MLFFLLRNIPSSSLTPKTKGIHCRANFTRDYHFKMSDNETEIVHDSSGFYEVTNGL